MLLNKHTFGSCLSPLFIQFWNNYKAVFRSHKQSLLPWASTSVPHLYNFHYMLKYTSRNRLANRRCKEQPSNWIPLQGARNKDWKDQSSDRLLVFRQSTGQRLQCSLMTTNKAIFKRYLFFFPIELFFETYFTFCSTVLNLLEHY